MQYKKKKLMSLILLGGHSVVPDLVLKLDFTVSHYTNFCALLLLKDSIISNYEYDMLHVNIFMDKT